MIMASRAPSWPGIRPVKTCTECKQAKLRCDSRAKFPNPCSRCQSRHLTCTVDPAFQRTPARKRLEAMSKELQELRDQRDTDYVIKRRPSTIDSPSQGSSGTSRYSPQEIMGDEFELDVTSLEIGGVTVEVQTAIEIFKVFATFFRPHFPILGSISLNSIYYASPFLFWTIIALVSARIYDSPNSVFDRIRGPYDELLKTEILNAPLPLQKIQALLHLCVWALPVETQTEDPSWLYCGIALNSALYMGLHRQGSMPSLRSVGVASGSTQARANTWLGCFYVSTALGMHLGLPSLINSDSDIAAIRSILNEYTPSHEFATQVRVQLVVASFASILSNNSNIEIDSSLVRMLDSELDAIKTTCADSWTDMAELGVLAAKLHFYALVITRVRPGATSREILLKLGLGVSLRIAHLTNARLHDNIVETHNLTPQQRLRTHPKNYFRGLAFATVFLLRYFSLNSAAHADEQQMAANHVMIAHHIFQGCATSPQDEFGRAATFFETLSRQAPISADTTKLRLTDRMGVSILLDAVSTASEVRGRPVEITESETPKGTPVYAKEEQPYGIHRELPINGPQQEHQQQQQQQQQQQEPWLTDLTLANNDLWNDAVWDMFGYQTGFPHAGMQPQTEMQPNQ